jgi:N-acetylmuramoyl-L-alanine amidase
LPYFFISSAPAQSLENGSSNNKVKIVVIDPGHGGHDPGALGKKIKEKDVVLAVGLKLGKYIEDNFSDVRVVYTRKTDIFIPLDERAMIANKNKADLFISIHANSLPKSPAIGTETFVMGINKDAGNLEVAKKENSVITLEENYETKYEGFDPNSADSYIIFSIVQKTYQEHSLLFADMVQTEFETRAKRVNRGVKQSGFWVLWRTTMPSVLVETGFLTHPDEEKYLGSEEGQDYLASAIFRAFKMYKESIENKSHFENLAIQAEAESKNIELQSLIEDNLIKDKGLYFKVQVVTSKNPIKLDDPYFKNYKFAEEFKTGKLFKYAIGNSPSYKEIIEFAKTAKADFPDSFIIAVKNDQIISLRDALEEINNMNNEDKK